LPNPSVSQSSIVDAPSAPPVRSAEERVAAGRSVYNANCIACHHLNPAEDGVLGPAIAGASRELIEARVLRGEYPEGYVPKRPTKVMIPLPHLAPRLDELTAYLDSVD
jgi:mono/diheme cytochrome c family protein